MSDSRRPHPDVPGDCTPPQRLTAAWFPKPPILAQIPKDGHAVIEASAGTGKTFTIEHLIVDLLLSTPCDLDHLLVVTFTEKATHELRARVRALIQRVASTPSGVETPADPKLAWRVDPPLRAKLDRALFGFDRANISTIHGFCHRILNEMAFHHGELFEVSLVDGRQAFGRAFREALREELAVAPDHEALLRLWLDEHTATELEDLLMAAHDKRYGDIQAERPARAQAHAQSMARAFDREQMAADYEAAGIAKKAKATALAVIDELARRLAALRDPDAGDAALDALFEIDASALLKPRRQSRAGRPFPDGLSPSTQQVLSRLSGFRRHHRPGDSVAERVVAAFLPVVEARLATHKRREGTLDFDDLLARVWENLEGPQGDALVQALRSRFRYALIDEFQDTDDVQWRIFQRVFVESPGHNRLYVIGDPKQAIYGFRGADVFTYLGAREILTQRGAPQLVLGHNYRSTPSVIRACNEIIDQQATRPLFTGSIRYDSPVQCGNPSLCATDPTGRATAPITLLAVDPTITLRPGVPGLRDALGRAIADHLRQLLFDPKRQLRVGPADRPRPLKARDVFILTRSGGEGLRLGAHLLEAGVPHAFYKQEGLFQTKEAYDIHDVLAAVIEPHVQGKRLRAWATPLFGVPWETLGACQDLGSEHPLVRRLLDWKALADRNDSARLFDVLLHQSGLVERALLLARSERELTNYVHIFEVLSEAASGSRLGTVETLAVLRSYLSGAAQPVGQDGDVQRLESERDAVQIMTVHKSKGLEAHVVYLFGGLLTPPSRDAIHIYHEDLARTGITAMSVGKDDKDIKGRIKSEANEENQRLLYVALTRAKSKLVLPYIENARALRRFDGMARQLNDRLADWLTQPAASPDDPLWEIERGVGRLPTIPSPVAPNPDAAIPTRGWQPPSHLLERSTTGPRFAELAVGHAPLRMLSYSSLKAAHGGFHAPPALDGRLDAFADSAAAAIVEAPLPGGRAMGQCLHQIIERADFDTLARSTAPDDWVALPAVGALAETTMLRYDIEPRWRSTVLQLVYDTLKHPMRLDDGRPIPAFCTCQGVREMEFLYPVPEGHHPLLDRTPTPPGGPAWTVGTGYLKGFIDYVFEHDGRVYIVDWKTDVLPTYEPSVVVPHVAANYAYQAKIYALSMVRLMQIRSASAYDRRFGGLLYIFLRGRSGAPESASGIYYERPSWSDIQGDEQELMTLTAALPNAAGRPTREGA